VGRLFVFDSLFLLYTLLVAIDNSIQALGKGTFGEVWLCEHKTRHVQVAVKKFLKIPGNSDQEEMIELWRKEVKNMMLLSFPDVVLIYDSFEDSNYFYIVMEYCSRGNLRAHLSKIQVSGKCMTEPVCLFFYSFSAVSLSCFSICP
jgi:serine/threonine protein kinase